MASVEKFTDDAMAQMLRHNARTIANPSNTDIDSLRNELNYSFPLNHGGLTNYQYYKKLISEKYLYGRGSTREKEAITGCGWVVTLPKELLGCSEKEHAFFKGTFEFISERYGPENIINNAIHYDESGLPHLHVVFCPVTVLDHDVVQYKTVKTSTAIKLNSGRYEYKHRFILDEHREKIPLKNYAKMTDYYEEKIDCNSVLNKIELRNFHSDLQKYLSDNGIEGKVITGKTGTNFTVKELKEFTQNTGLHLSEVKELQTAKSILESYVERNSKVTVLEQVLQEKEALIQSLHETIRSRDISLDRMAEMAKTLEITQLELNRANTRIEELEKQKTIETSYSDKNQEWGHQSSLWGNKSQSEWGSNKNFEEEKTW